MKKKLLVMATLTAMTMSCLSGCGEKKETTTEQTTVETTSETTAATTEEVVTTTEEVASESEADEENYNTGDAKLDNVRNQDEIGEKELLVISFGTSFNDSRRLTIGAIEQKIDDEFGNDYSVRRGFTSQIIIDHVKRRDDVAIDNVKEALDRAIANNVKTLVIQPTHLMDGFEYNDVVNEVAEYSDSFEKVSIGKPLLSSDEDFVTVMNAIVKATEKYDDGETAICFMGHGTEADSNAVYEKMQNLLKENGHDNYFIGTVEAEPTLETLVGRVKEGNYKKVVLQPLMIVAGDHANNDMAGDEEDSWKTTFESNGYDVTCVLEGLGQIPEIQDLFVEHAKQAAAEAE
ncbi:MAG: sirohydrochlorin cobaltochelatase [Lachnospiraceae bacterium]|nr:sirohydrochlorin cobaltochelatase [Lachnospiraceae bacterium]